MPFPRNSQRWETFPEAVDGCLGDPLYNTDSWHCFQFSTRTAQYDSIAEDTTFVIKLRKPKLLQTLGASNHQLLIRCTVTRMNPSWETGPKHNQKEVGYCYNSHDTIAPLGVSFLVGWNYIMQHLALGEAIDSVFSPNSPHIAFGTIEVNQ